MTAQLVRDRLAPMSHPYVVTDIELTAEPIRVSRPRWYLLAVAVLVGVTTVFVAGGSSPVNAADQRAAATTWQVAATVTPHAVTAIQIPRTWTTTSGVAWQIEVGTNATSALVTVSAGGNSWDTGKLPSWPVGSTHHVAVGAEQDGANVDMTITVDGVKTTLPLAFRDMTLGAIR